MGEGVGSDAVATEAQGVVENSSRATQGESMGSFGSGWASHLGTRQLVSPQH